ncbi:MAG TPA: nucleotidyltransferase domain-containing protein, partial [Chloroflexota bacterium]|nr:nucleotidyltransferase domain-containing protein [Chloroflexota bacterium]
MADARAVVAPLVQDLTAAIRDALGANLLALYLWGSYAVGDFDPQLSDVDLVAVVHRNVTGDEYAALDALHRQIAARYPVWAGRVEVAYATRATLDHPETGGEIVRISPGEPLNRRRSDSRWTVDWYVVRTRGIPLHGPPPTVLLAPITPAQFVESVRANVDTVGEWVETVRGRRGDAYAILLMCRALRATLHGDQLSK